MRDRFVPDTLIVGAGLSMAIALADESGWFPILARAVLCYAVAGYVATMAARRGTDR